MSAPDAGAAAGLDPAPTDAELRAARKRTFLWVVGGWVSWAMVFCIAWFVVPRPAAIASPVDRLLLALQLAAGPAAVLMLILQGLWRLGDTLAAENPLLGKESYLFKINQRVMTNTVEQTLIFVPMFVALAIRMQPDRVFQLPLLMGFWCIARVMFWIGYRQGLHLRAPGMDWTSGTSMATAVLLAATLF